MPDNLQRIGSTYYYVRRVPKRYRDFDRRGLVKISLHTSDLSAAHRKKEAAKAELEAYWKLREAGRHKEAVERFNALKQIASRFGLAYRPASEAHALPLDEMVDRLELAADLKHRGDHAGVAAILGGEEEPDLTLSQAFPVFASLVRDETMNKSPKQIKKWTDDRKRSVDHFIAIAGDRELSAYTTADANAFQQWWLDRVAKEGKTRGALNKEIQHLSKLFRVLESRLQLGLGNPFKGMRVSKRKDDPKRPELSTEWIVSRLLAPGAFATMRPDYRAIVHALINTGARPSEIINLVPERIVLEAPIPFIDIHERDDRDIKARNSRRRIPLVGCSLAAFRAYPAGWPDLQDREGSVCAAINKFMKENGLREKPDTTLYSLRHSFESRLLAAGVDERVRSDLMGHSYHRPRYGEGDLSIKQAALRKIAVGLRT